MLVCYITIQGKEEGLTPPIMFNVAIFCKCLSQFRSLKFSGLNFEPDNHIDDTIDVI